MINLKEADLFIWGKCWCLRLVEYFVVAWNSGVVELNCILVHGMN